MGIVRFGVDCPVLTLVSDESPRFESTQCGSDTPTRAIEFLGQFTSTVSQVRIVGKELDQTVWIFMRVSVLY